MSREAVSSVVFWAESSETRDWQRSTLWLTLAPCILGVLSAHWQQMQPRITIFHFSPSALEVIFHPRAIFWSTFHCLPLPLPILLYCGSSASKARLAKSKSLLTWQYNYIPGLNFANQQNRFVVPAVLLLRVLVQEDSVAKWLQWSSHRSFVCCPGWPQRGSLHVFPISSGLDVLSTSECCLFSVTAQQVSNERKIACLPIHFLVPSRFWGRLVWRL